MSTSNFEYAARWIDAALGLADSVALTTGYTDEEIDWRYQRVREYLHGAHDILRPVVGDYIRAPRAAVSLALSHLPALPMVIPAGTRIENPRRIDSRLGTFASQEARLRWLVETQNDRLMEAGELLRDLATPQGGTPPEIEKMKGESIRDVLRILMRLEATREGHKVKVGAIMDELGPDPKNDDRTLYNEKTVDKARAKLQSLGLITGDRDGYWVTERGVAIAFHLKESWGRF